MKKTLILFTIILFASSFNLPSKKLIQISKLIPSTYSITTDGTLTGTSGQLALEKITASYQNGKGKSTTPVVTITGLKSTLRLYMGAFFKFLTTYDSGPMPIEGFVLHPGTDIMLYKFTVDKKNRTSASPLQVTFTQVDKGIFRIDIPAGVALDKGEYAFIDKTTLTSTGAITAWCFGID